MAQWRKSDISLSEAKRYRARGVSPEEAVRQQDLENAEDAALASRDYLPRRISLKELLLDQLNDMKIDVPNLDDRGELIRERKETPKKIVLRRRFP